MNIGITCYPVPGGSGVVATELGGQLAGRGHNVHFITHDRPWRLERFGESVRFHQVETPDYPLFHHAPYTLSLASKMIEVAREHDLDLWHVHYAIPHAAAGHLAREAMGTDAPKLVATLHGTDITLVGVHPSFYPVTKFSIESCDAITTVSSYLADTTRERFCTECDIDVIPNFVDTDRFRQLPSGNLRTRYAPNSEKIIAHLSNFRPVKNVNGVIRIFARVAAQLPSVLLMIGEGPDCTGALALADELGVRERVHFLGNREDVEWIFADCDLFLLPSRYEAFGLAALEAMACGVPVVASDIGGVPELIDDGETGFLAAPDDWDTAAGHAVRVLSDAKLSESIRSNALRVVRDRFTADRIVPQYEAIYDRMLSA